MTLPLGDNRCPGSHKVVSGTEDMTVAICPDCGNTTEVQRRWGDILRLAPHAKTAE